MGRVDEKKKSKKKALMNSAFALFTEKGITKTSVSEISLRAGVAKGTFYLYFKDKTDIQKSLILFHTKRLFSDAIRSLSEDETNPETAIMKIAEHVIDDLIRDRKLMEFIAKNLNWGQFRAAMEAGNDSDALFCRDYFKSLTKDKIDNPHLMLFMIMELVGGTCYASEIEKSIEPIENIKPYLTAAIGGIIDKFRIRGGELSDVT